MRDNDTQETSVVLDTFSTVTRRHVNNRKRMEVQQANNQREGTKFTRLAGVRKCNVTSEVWIGWYCLWSLLHGDPGCKCETSDNERYTCKGRSMCKGEDLDCPSYGWWLDVVHRDSGVVHLQRRNHGNRLHYVFALGGYRGRQHRHRPCTR